MSRRFLIVRPTGRAAEREWTERIAADWRTPCRKFLATPLQLAADMDDNLFANILNSPHQVLHEFFPDKTDHPYNLRYRHHSLSLTVKSDYDNFLNRLLLKTFISCSLVVVVAFCQLCLLKKWWCCGVRIHRVNWRHRVYGHDTFAILWE